MKMIKYIVGYICLLISLGISHAGYAQEVQYEEHSLRILVKPIVSNKNIPNMLFADSTLNAWIQDVRPSFPHSQDEMLRRVYLLHFDCNLQQMQKRLAELPWIEELMPIEIVPDNMLYTPTDYFWTVTKSSDPTYLWHLTKIEAEKAWDITKGSPDVKIAVIDRIIDATHLDLVNKMVYDYDPYDPNIKMKPTALDHGTAVASFAAASTNDPESSKAQLASIGFNCKIVGYEVDDNFLEKSHHASFVENAAVIVSCAGNGISQTPTNTAIEEKVVKEILNNGTIIVTPAGNGFSHRYSVVNGELVHFYPFNLGYDNRIIVVSSTDINDNHTYYNEDSVDVTHSHYKEVTVCAPGYSMMGAKPTIDNNGNHRTWPYYGGYSGTSFAAPIVAGLCGLMKSILPQLTPAKAKRILETTTDPIKDAHLYPGQLGTGRINAYKAVAAVKQYAHDCQAIYIDQTISGQNINKDVCVINMKNTTITGKASVTFNLDGEAQLKAGFSVEKGSTFNLLFQEL